ncbi:hypothetical protein PVAND_016234 [Polypedilum vanderplanki]|uniref:Uncharacterized protein n=1 Tax=Polypedilum vanderplanki TaxID=319348 RepID=A0A9J6BF98_POLVA|nr:hypothetical protein PVAND_016234 [Polypedilum vanderplanki]
MFAIFIIFQLFLISNSFTVNCNYGYWDIVQINTLYQCETTNILTTSGEFVTNVTGTHLNGKNYNDIEAIKIDGKYSLSFVPRGLKNFFPKIRVIHIFFASIGTLFGDEFDEFPNLEYLALTSCGLTTISSKLFENTPKIAFVTFNNNQLKRIGFDLFTPLNVRQLREVNFAYVGCISRSVYTENVISLINDLRQKCPYDDEFPPTTTTIKNILCPDKNIEEFVCDLKNLMIELQDDLTAKNERINKIESELFQIKEEVKQLRREMFNQE